MLGIEFDRKLAQQIAQDLALWCAEKELPISESVTAMLMVSSDVCDQMGVDFVGMAQKVKNLVDAMRVEFEKEGGGTLQ